MGQMAQKIVKLNIPDLIRTLNEAFAEEWLAYYQYWIGARLAHGKMQGTISEEFKKHAKEEREHAELLADRILQLGGTPVVTPDDWSKLAKCRYEIPIKTDTQSLVAQVLTAERCAIGRYQGLCDLCFGKDYETFRISKHILKEELDHEQDMEGFEEDMRPTETSPETL